MSRTNPYKKKRRAARQTLLIFGEGLGEEMFLKHLRGLYARSSNVAVTIRRGKGGSPVNVVIEAAKELGDFNRRIVVLDNDKTMEEMRKARHEAKKKNIEILENTPCLEATFLSILNGGTSYAMKKSDWCKNKFESKYPDKKRRAEPREYAKLFPKTLLDEERSKVLELDKLISLMQRRKLRE